MFLLIRFDRIRNYIAAGVVVLAFALGIILLPRIKHPVMAEYDNSTLVIDPGHGGVDGGAISLYGNKESDINLAIAQKLQVLAELYGQNCVMTRSSDASYTTYPDYSEHAELVHRVEIANSQKNAVMLSIHQNCFPDARVSGSQILYAPTDGSKELGTMMQANFLQHLDPYNRRVAEPAPKKLFITANVNCTALLLECGFLSNAQDCEALTDDTYQTKLASVMLATFLQYKGKTV